jgi:hypothetical protein
LTVFVATSKRFYGEALQFVKRLKGSGVTVHHPYFHLDTNEVDADPELKSQVTLQHFPEIDESEILYALLPGGYIGCSVTIEIAYAYAKGKKIVVSEPPSEFAVRPMISEICSPEQFLARLCSLKGTSVNK